MNDNGRLTNQQIYRIVNDYIGVSGGYLGDFSYSTHSEFYPYYCNLDINPNSDPYTGTTRERFMEILRSVDAISQAKILKGVLAKYPTEGFPEECRAFRTRFSIEIETWIKSLEGSSAFLPQNVKNTSETVRVALADAKVLLHQRGPVSAVDRVHTAFHGYLKYLCTEQKIEAGVSPTMVQLLKKMRTEHPAFSNLGPRTQDIEKVLNSMAAILDALNPIRNNASVAHPNESLVTPHEATLVTNATIALLTYLDGRISDWKEASANLDHPTV